MPDRARGPGGRVFSVWRTDPGMSVLERISQSFGMFPLLLLAATFSLLAPLFWTHVEAPVGPAAVNYENPEVYGRVLPSVTYGYNRLRAGEWPLWSPQQYGGTPYFSNPVHGMFQPLNLIFLAVPPITGLALHAFAGLFLMAILGALLLRLLGTAWIPAAIGGLVYAFCGATVSVMSLPELLGTLIWPPVLYAVIHLHTGSPGRPYMVAGGFVTAFLLLSGQPALGAIHAVGALIYGVVRAWVLHRHGQGDLPRTVRGLAAMALLGVAISSIQWVPWLMWLGTLANPAEGIWPRSIPGHLAAQVGEVPAALLVPRTASVPGLLYFGAIPLVLLPPALLHRSRRFEVIYFLVASVLWIGLAVWGAVPGASSEGWKLCVYPGALGIAILVGIGADRLLLTGRDPRSPLIWGSVVIALVAALLLLLIGTAESRGRIAMAVVVLLPFFVLRLRWVGAACGVALAFLIFVDFREASRNVYQHPFTGPANWLSGCQAALQEAETHTLGDRMLALPASRESILPANLGMAQRVKVAGRGG